MRFILSLMIVLITSFSAGQAIKKFKHSSNRIDIALPEGTLSICPLTENAVRIKFLKDVDVRMPELVFISDVQTPRFTVSDLPSRLEVRVENTVVALDKRDGRLAFEIARKTYDI